MTPQRIVVATSEPIGSRMAGPAIRAWNIAEQLASEHEIVLATTGAVDRHDPRFVVRHVDPPSVADLERWMDVLVFQGGFLHDHPALIESEKVIVADVYDPFHLENLEQVRDQSPAAAASVIHHLTAVLNEQLTRADFILCANSRQRDFWLGSLASLGRINPWTYEADPTLGQLLAIAPFGIPELPPTKKAQAIRGVVPGIGADDKVVLWAGGVYNWFDPCSLVRAIDGLRTRIPEVRLLFMGMQHPNPHIPVMRVAAEVRALAADRGLIGTHVFFNDAWVDYENRADYLLEADAGVSTHLQHIETEFSFRTRVLDYLWAGLPMVLTEGDSFADLVSSEQLGVAVPPADPAAIEEALHAVLRSPPSRERIRDVSQRFTWPKALAPLIDFCRAPRRAHDLGAIGWTRAEQPVPKGILLKLANRYREGGPPAVWAALRRRLRSVQHRGG